MHDERVTKLVELSDENTALVEGTCGLKEFQNQIEAEVESLEKGIIWNRATALDRLRLRVKGKAAARKRRKC